MAEKLVKILEPYKGRQRLLAYDKDDTENPWRILGANCSWYFATREAAEEWYLAERAPRRRGRRGKWS